MNVVHAFEEYIKERIQSMHDNHVIFVRPEVGLFNIQTPKEIQGKNEINLIMSEGSGLLQYITALRVDKLIVDHQPLGISYFFNYNINSQKYLVFLFHQPNNSDPIAVIFHNQSTEDQITIQSLPLEKIDMTDYHPYYLRNPFRCHTCRKCKIYKEVLSPQYKEQASVREQECGCSMVQQQWEECSPEEYKKKHKSKQE